MEMLTAEEPESIDEKVKALGKEIDELEATLPVLGKENKYEWLKMKSAIKDKDIERSFLIEKQRCSQAVKQYFDENPDVLEAVPDCPICLEKQWDPVSDTVLFICCGKSICAECDERGGSILDTCPLCRSPSIAEDEEATFMRLLEEKAKGGNAWAMREVGQRQLKGIGMEENVEEGLALLHEAAERGNVDAMHTLGCHFTETDNGQKSHQFFQRAAANGNISALGELGRSYAYGEGCEQDLTKALNFLTVSATLCGEPNSKTILAQIFLQDVKGSPVLQCHYLRPAAEAGDESSMAKYGLALIFISCKYYAFNFFIPGYNPFPEALFWFRRSKKKGYQDSKIAEMFTATNQLIRSKWSHCLKRLSSEKPRWRCAECQATYYCCSECQVANWKAGHKRDCIRKLKKRLKAAGKL